MPGEKVKDISYNRNMNATGFGTLLVNVPGECSAHSHEPGRRRSFLPSFLPRRGLQQQHPRMHALPRRLLMLHARSPFFPSHPTPPLTPTLSCRRQARMYAPPPPPHPTAARSWPHATCLALHRIPGAALLAAGSDPFKTRTVALDHPDPGYPLNVILWHEVRAGVGEGA